MKSRIIGSITLDQRQLSSDLDSLSQFKNLEQYSEYIYGKWYSHVLLNETGKMFDTTFRNYPGEHKKTSLGIKLKYLNFIVENNFIMDHLKWARLFVMEEGLLIPHMDFIELSVPYVRINLPILTNKFCLHSEDNDVFHMRAGEIWHLNATSVHAACNYTNIKRIMLCLDFENVDNKHVDEFIKPNAKLSMSPQPYLIKRDKLADDWYEYLYNFSKHLSPYNYKDIVQLLGKVHFYKQANAADCYEWLIAISGASKHQDLSELSKAYRDFCIVKRKLGERFNLDDYLH